MSLLVSVVLMRTCYVKAVVTVCASWAYGTKTGNGAVVNNRFILTCYGAVCLSVNADGMFVTYISGIKVQRISDY
jgi:hypothetical protein